MAARRKHRPAGLCVGALGMLAWGLCAAQPARGSQMNDPAEQLRAIDPHVLPAEKRDTLQQMLPADLRRRIAAANLASTAEWSKLRSRDDWERFRDAKRARLRESLGPIPAAPPKPDLHVSGSIEGEGFGIRNLVYRSREGLWVTANLYEPVRRSPSMPGILLCHSHHAPKEQGELQDMGMTWARAGCVVLVPDMLGHGERRQHPFATAGDFAKGFRVGRQDYYFRYDVGMQLHLAGEGLMGWLVWDLMRGVDVLLAQPGVDPRRIILLGAVAGGGDPAAVAAALDERIACAVPFNFGGPQPETAYPLPAGAEPTFNYAGSGSFESTRNLRRSAAEGFLPWGIVAAIAPRRLVYAHEFSWDRARDPVWQRLERVWGFYEAGDSLAAVHGQGTLRGRPPEASHCTNIGAVHRRGIHPLLKRWFGIAVTPDDEYSHRRDAGELRCMTPELQRELRPRRLCDVLPEIAARKVAAIRGKAKGMTPAQRRALLRAEWAGVLGNVQPASAPTAEAVSRTDAGPQGAAVERLVLHVEPGIAVPVLLLTPRGPGRGATGCVVGLAQGGKAGFLRHRPAEIAELLGAGLAVCLPDLRGTGEADADGSRERWGAMTAHSSAELMLGGTMVGARLRDVRSLLRYLRGRGDIDAKRIALWGDSFAAPNPPGTDFRMPRNVDGRPRWSEPLGGMLALLGGLFDDDVAAVCVRGGLSDLASVLTTQFVYVPHDAIVPRAICAGDLPELAAALAPRPLCLEGLVDGLNRSLDLPASKRLYQPALDAWRQADAPERLTIRAAPAAPATWLAAHLAPR